jgi:cold shock CspA family protein
MGVTQTMRGSITAITKNDGRGIILGEDGYEVYFDQSSFDGFNFHQLFVGDWVEFEERSFGVRLRAAKIRPVQAQTFPSRPR